MATMTDPRSVVRRLLEEQAAIPYAYGDVRTFPLFDDERGHDALLDVGWEGPQRVHGCLVHVTRHDDKAWIEYDGTEDGIASEPVAAGIPTVSTCNRYYLLEIIYGNRQQSHR